MHESKEKGHETTDFFSVVSRSWRSPLIHVGAPTKGWAPLHHEEQVITKNAPTPSSERRASHHVQVSFFVLTQTPIAHQEPPITKTI